MNESFEIQYVDKDAVKTLKGENLEREFEKLLASLKYILGKVKDVHDDYKLDNFTASIGVSFGAWVVTAEGGITLTWTKK